MSLFPRFHEVVREVVRLEAELQAERERADALKLALDKADPLDPSFLRYLELEQQLHAEREKSASLQHQLGQYVELNALTGDELQRLEALAELAAEMAEGPMPWVTFKARYLALTTQAPAARQ